MWFKTYDVVDDEQLRGAQKNLIRDGVTAQAMGVLTGGAFLIAFALHLGASNLVIGLLAAIGPLAQILQLPGIFLVEKLRNRRAITVITAALSRLGWVGIILIPFFIEEKSQLTALLIALAVISAIGAISGCAWNSWMRDLIPEKMMGSFFSRRMRVAMGVSILLSFAGGQFLDFWKARMAEHELWGYLILFILGLMCGIGALFFLGRVPEVRMPALKPDQKLLPMLVAPFRDANFRRLMAFLCSWNFGMNLAGPFFMVYMLRRLEMSMSAIITLSVLCQIANYMCLKLWGKYVDMFSNKSVLSICAPLFIVTILGWTFTTMPDRYFLSIPLLILIHVVMGVTSAGISLAAGNISLKLAPKGQATAYLATNTIMNSLAAGIAPIIGGKCVDFFAGRELAWTLKYTTPEDVTTLPTLNLQQWDFFFFFAFIIGAFSLTRLVKIKEAGEVEEKIVMNELFSEVRTQVRTLSSVEGVRQMVSMPIVFFRGMNRQKSGNGKEVSALTEKPAGPTETQDG